VILQVHLSTPSDRTIGKAVEIIRSGGILIYPTDTVYGLGCSVEDRNAIERIHLVKRQRQDKPFSFICSDLTHISEYAHVSNLAFKTMKRLIPGPFTFILPAARMKHLPRILVSKRKTVGIRVPDSQVTLALVTRVGHPILSTSVTDEEGEILNDPDRIVEEYGNVVDLILDAGPLNSNPSTVLDLTGERAVIVRQGAGDATPVL
jgi:tRNA threonylcarbamoyl adenosine modification protein (Sua5/YciO/YrdC/YwlC family)